MHLGDDDAHDVLLHDVDVDLLFGKGDGRFEHVLAHLGGGDDKRVKDVGEFLLHFIAHLLVLTHFFDESAHELVLFVLEELVSTLRRNEPFFERG